MRDDKRHLPIATRTCIAVLLFLVLALLIQARIALDLAASGYDDDHALALARLATLPVLVVIVLALLREQRPLVLGTFAVRRLDTRLLLTGLAAGILLRIAAWAKVTASGAFGLLDDARAAPPQNFSAGFDCPSLVVLAVAILAWLVVVPLTEELVHRGIVQSYLARWGKVAAIGGSTLVFTLLHEPGSYAWIATMGLVFALQFWNARSLWLPLITHASYDGLVPLDELCLQLAWNPSAAELPVMGVGLIASAVFVGTAMPAFWLCRETWVGPPVRRSDLAALH